MKLKGIFLLILLLLAIASADFLYLRTDRNPPVNKNITEAQEIDLTAGDLIVTPQTATDKVIVESVTLYKDGFVVARQMDDGKLSQVIEMSQSLKKGTHKNIPINLGGADVKNKELIVMIYEDYDNDSVFNDLDMPALTENGSMTARFVKTGKPLPTNITEGESAGMVHTMAGMKTMAKVRYTDKGFVPDKVEVPVGSTVEFINESSTEMWVASIPHPAHSKLPTFDQFKLYKKGAIYRYVFEKKGTWEYHDHIKPALGGIVIVK